MTNIEILSELFPIYDLTTDHYLKDLLYRLIGKLESYLLDDIQDAAFRDYNDGEVDPDWGDVWTLDEGLKLSYTWEDGEIFKVIVTQSDGRVATIPVNDIYQIQIV